MHLNHPVETALGAGAAGYALHHAAKGTPIGEEGNIAATAGRVWGNCMVAWVFAKFVILPYLVITALICLGPAILVFNNAHTQLVQCNANNNRCKPISVTGGYPSSGTGIDQYGNIGTNDKGAPIGCEGSEWTGENGGGYVPCVQAVATIQHRTVYNRGLIGFLGMMGLFVWLYFPGKWMFRFLRKGDRWLSGRDLDTGQRKPHIVYGQDWLPGDVSYLNRSTPS